MRYPNEKSVKFVIVIASSSLLLAQYMQWIRYDMIMEKLWAFSRESSRFLPENRDQQHVAFARAKEEKSDGRPLQQRSVSLAIFRQNFPFRHRSARIAPPAPKMGGGIGRSGDRSDAAVSPPWSRLPSHLLSFCAELRPGSHGALF